MRVLICGSRNDDPTPGWVARCIDKIVHAISPCRSVTMVIHGDCPTGADSIAREVASLLGAHSMEFRANWISHGRSAGPIRNQAMIDEKPEVVVALWDGSSRGTLDTIKRATLAGIPIFIAPTTWEGDAV